ncbi:hypothetical protein Dimus_006247 [Dionaea muscipula]
MDDGRALATCRDGHVSGRWWAAYRLDNEPQMGRLSHFTPSSLIGATLVAAASRSNMCRRSRVRLTFKVNRSQVGSLQSPPDAESKMVGAVVAIIGGRMIMSSSFNFIVAVVVR